MLALWSGDLERMENMLPLWFGHLKRMENNSLPRKYWKFEFNGNLAVGQSKKTWREPIQRNSEKWYVRS